MSRKENLATPTPEDTRPLYEVTIERTITEVQSVRVRAETSAVAKKTVEARVKAGRHRNGWRRPKPAGEPAISTTEVVN